jgi:hypothetical protein
MMPLYHDEAAHDTPPMKRELQLPVFMERRPLLVLKAVKVQLSGGDGIGPAGPVSAPMI